uniref:Str_synth domain-containing protein n=1 Tax=Meloidogyne hapla TaxID=6305 RepID=A0A1I8BGG6_MELHA
MDGKCLKIVDGKIVKTIPMTKNKGCEALTRQSIAYCGRPLGIRRRNDKQFIVADAALGIIGIDFEKESVETLLSTTKPIDGLKMRFPDDFDFIDNDTIVFSDASTRYGYRDFLLSFLEHGGDGRIIKFKFSTGETQVLVDGLDFPNGVQMHTDKQKGRLEIFIDNLPGYPDNIRISSSGTSFYVALFSHRNADNQDLFQKLGDWLMTRKVLGMLFRIFPSTIVEILFNRGYGIAIEIDLDGKIIRSFHDPQGTIINDISQAC